MSTPEWPTRLLLIRRGHHGPRGQFRQHSCTGLTEADVGHAREVVKFINERHDTTVRVVGRFPRGEQGAFALADPGGARFVLKWRPNAQSLGRILEVQSLVRRLCDAGYPAPRYAAVGQYSLGSYAVQEALPGAPAEEIDMSLLRDVFTLNALQERRASRADGSWPARVIDEILFGGPGYCLLDPMRDFSPTTARLLSALQAFVAAHAHIPARTDDIVHFDFNPSNILVISDRISGVVDWEGVCAGDRAFDLATLLLYSYENAQVRDALWAQLIALADPALVCVYLAHLIHRQIDWSIRHHERAVIEGWLDIAKTILHDPRVRADGAPPRWP